jgi:GAF domain-containing protein
MRWFVEVSRVGDPAPAERYCLEAKAWQAALQDARKLRGDAGPLSKFSIELLDQGYRAVDPIQKIRYLVNQAPADAPLLGASQAPPPAEVPLAPTLAAQVAPHVAPVVTSAVVAEHVAQPPAASAAAEHVEPAAAVKRPPTATRAADVQAAGAAETSPAPLVAALEEAPLPLASKAAAEVAGERAGPPRPVTSRPAPAAEGALGAVRKTVVKARLELADTRERETSAYPAPRPLSSAPSADSALNGSSDVRQAASAASPPRAEVKSASRAPAGASSPRVGGPSVAAARPGTLPFREFRTRLQPPTADAPITYREAAYEVASGSSREQVEGLLRERLQATQEELSQNPPGQLVQLAVFDHAFEQRPLRPPLGTLAWKDWRGEPVLGFPAFGESMPPVSASLPPRHAISGDLESPSAEGSPGAAPSSEALFAATPAPALTYEEARAGMPAASALPEAAPATTPAAPGVVAPVVDTPTAFASSDTPVQPPAGPQGAQGDVIVDVAELAASPHDAEPPPPAAEPLLAQAPALAALSAATAVPQPEKASELSTVAAAPPVRPPSVPDVERASRPRIAIARRRAGEDLIGELFELMHELHFARDIGMGSDFLQGVLAEVLPSEVSFIQVFDINTRCFVVVRARGAGAERALMHRTPDKDPLTREIMRADGARARSAQDDPRYLQGRWSHVTVPVTQVLSGPVRQGGRYLGSIELANPLGGTPFHQTEINAFDYICKQFADFVASRPVVLDEDVVLGH